MGRDEKTSPSPVVDSDVDVAAAESQTYNTKPVNKWLSKVSTWGVELRGITPVPLEERVDKRFINVFFVWFAMSTNLLPIITGMVAYFSTFGSRTGLRQMLHARYTFGYYLISIIVILNLCTISGFGIIDCVLGGSTLAAVSGGKIDSTAGIVIIAIIAMVVSFGGYRFLHQYERYSWIVSLIAIIITTGVGGKELFNQVEVEPASAATIVSYGGVVAGFLIPWAAMAADFSVYCDSTVSTFRIFAYTYAGLCFPTVPLMVLGAAIGGATANNEAWAQGYDEHIVGGVLQAMLTPAGGFGKFVAVLLSLSVVGNLAAAMYSITLNFQLLVPLFLRVPRNVFAIIYTVVAIPVSISAARTFFSSLENFIYLIAYWSAAFVAVVGMEHFVFRRADCASYDTSSWDQPSRLPTGIAAIVAMGPIAETTGDIGFEVALVLAALLYLPCRWIELKIRPV
ncbi:putative purine-cytosine permease fcy22 protein [Eutypa lata UCREL1]|uniref:Putative purine-cytosine permease fcy22 protein n=1 Tax=Eutypa lata (strain UCR-EL1) TaxID=1287681 RepID=M7TU12_EUTLA|nr:putative purine-cytosine permease fcy22 protein [Eutypa lata UCREL1]